MITLVFRSSEDAREGYEQLTDEYYAIDENLEITLKEKEGEITLEAKEPGEISLSPSDIPEGTIAIII